MEMNFEIYEWTIEITFDVNKDYFLILISILCLYSTFGFNVTKLSREQCLYLYRHESAVKAHRHHLTLTLLVQLKRYLAFLASSLASNVEAQLGMKVRPFAHLGVRPRSRPDVNLWHAWWSCRTNLGWIQQDDAACVMWGRVLTKTAARGLLHRFFKILTCFVVRQEEEQKKSMSRRRWEVGNCSSQTAAGLFCFFVALHWDETELIFPANPQPPSSLLLSLSDSLNCRRPCAVSQHLSPPSPSPPSAFPLFASSLLFPHPLAHLLRSSTTHSCNNGAQSGW